MDVFCPECRNGQMKPKTLCGTCDGYGFVCEVCKECGTSPCECYEPDYDWDAHEIDM